MRRIVWWMGFTACGIWAQSHVPGVDFLVPGLILSLQVEKASQTVWLGLVWLLLQEGMGSLPFGFGLLWYAAATGLFLLGRWLFEARNLLFMSMLGLALGLLHYGLVLVMAGLQDWLVPTGRLLTESIHQVLFFPLEWAVIHAAYRILAAANLRSV
jgi:hypothetical protein